MGGKFRQRRAIADALRSHIDGSTTYVEPFLGGGWSFAHVIETCGPGRAIGADVNGSLVELWRKVVADGVDWLPTSLEEVEANYHAYKDAQDMSDPLTVWYGVACSFGGKWYGGIARDGKGDRYKGADAFAHCARSTERKAASMRTCPDLQLLRCSYDELEIPDGAVVYCDPPYEGRTKAHHFESFDYGEFWEWVKDLSSRCTVMVSCFDCPDDFTIVHQWGDTVVRHYRGKGTDGTNEKLVMLPC